MFNTSEDFKLFETLLKLLDDLELHQCNNAKLILLDTTDEPSVTYEMNCKMLKKLMSADSMNL